MDNLIETGGHLERWLADEIPPEMLSMKLGFIISSLTPRNYCLILTSPNIEMHLPSLLLI
jgi:hypothetical protein